LGDWDEFQKGPRQPNKSAANFHFAEAVGAKWELQPNATSSTISWFPLGSPFPECFNVPVNISPNNQNANRTD
jgi:hypothetical protein